VYVYPAFDINGKTITFAPGTFNVPGETLELIFDQSKGTGYDYSDYNSNAIATNHLGSSDPSLDRSANGRGIHQRNQGGVLQEFWLDEHNNLHITNPK
jgi:hypothetical protein